MCELVHRIDPDEFWKWLVILEEKDTHTKPEHYYAAVVAYRVYVLQHTVAFMFESDPPPLAKTLEDFILDFKDPDEDPEMVDDPEPAEETSEERQARLDRSKAAWLTIAGVNPDGTVRRQKPPKRKPPKKDK